MKVWLLKVDSNDFLGKKLSQQNAKQSKELKRLRDVEKEFEVLSLRFDELNEENARRADLEFQLKG
jgi:hypothetical protein